MVDDLSASAEILRRTRRTLRSAQVALEDLKKAEDPERRVAALHSVVVMGRAVTNVLQQLRGSVDRFDDWYKPWVEEMRSDPLLRYLYKLRSEVLKQGKDRTSASLHVRRFKSPDDLPPAPPNAVAFFMGDNLGGIGWEVQLEDGSREKVYVALPEEIAFSWLTFRNLPEKHLGSPLEDDSVEHVCTLYLRYLEKLINSAKDEFGSTELGR